MYRLVRIEGFHDFHVDSKLTFVLYDGSKYKSYDAHVSHSYFISIEGYSNHQIFDDLGISDRMEYCQQFSDITDGDFPVHKSITDLKKTLKSFFKLNPSIKIPSLYKVGDKVTIKSKYDSNSIDEDYHYSFTDIMLKNYGGKTYTISSINNVSSCDQSDRKHYLEPYFYRLKEISYNWTAAMFESKQKDSNSVLIDKITTSIKNPTVHFTDGNSIELYSHALYYEGFCNVIQKVTHDTSCNKYGYTFHSQITCSRRDVCIEPEVQDRSLKWVILDYLKYYFGTEECKKTINPEFYNYLKKKPEIISDKTEVKQTKTQGNAYQFCKMRGTVRVGDVPEGNRICGKRSKASVSSRPLGYRKVTGY